MDIDRYTDHLQLRHPQAFYMGGEWHPAQGSALLDVVHPGNERRIAQMPEVTTAEIDHAVACARTAFDRGPWPRMSAAERGAGLLRVAAILERRAAEVAAVWTLEVGAPTAFATAMRSSAARLFEYYGRLVQSEVLQEVRPRAGGGVGIVLQEPVGVVAAILPWNAPMALTCMTIAPALAAGCTVVLKPAPETPLYAWLLAECIEEAGLPPGTFNIVPAGREIGDHLVRHPGVDKVSLTGSTAAGRHIASVCGERLARVHLELGGKSPALILDDADPAEVVPRLVPHFTALSGQMCAALTRILVPAARRGEYAEAISAALAALKLGDPFDPQTFVGPLAMQRQHARVLGYIERGKAEGARLVTGGRRPAGLERGYYVEPTLFDGVTADMSIAQEEIFGPVAGLIAYADEEEAVSIANATIYGLNGAVFTKDPERALSLARRVRAGNVTHNGWVMDTSFPFGGFKQSGIGRAGGPEGLRAYFETKVVFMEQCPASLMVRGQ